MVTNQTDSNTAVIVFGITCQKYRKHEIKKLVDHDQDEPINR